jgi:outer membrane murein-binding lipoprotein Lpp
MTTYTKERRVLGKGLAATVTRAQERSETPLLLCHNYDASQVPGLLAHLQRFAPMGVSLKMDALAMVNSAALAASEAHVERLQSQLREAQAQVKALQEQINAQASAIPAEGTRWMTLPEATKIIGKSYSTLHRAHVDGRLVTRIIGGTKKDQIMCDPNTYREKIANKAG